MYDVVIYRGELCEIGGIETWVVNLAKRYHKTHKILVVYGSAHYNTLRDIARYVEIEKYTGQTIKAKKAIFCYDFIGFKTCEADEIIHVVHADHSQLSIKLDIPDEVDRVVSVSDVARRGLLSVSGVESDVVYNPIDISSCKRLIKLVSGTRLTSEKGLPRIEKLAKALDAAGVLYEWKIFTSYIPKDSFSPNVIFRPTTRHLLSYIKDSDYLVQLSDTESYGFSIVESLCCGTPVIVTDLPVLEEIGVDNTNSIIVPLEDVSYDAVVEKIVNSKLKFKYTPPKDKWGEIFGVGTGASVSENVARVRNIHGGDLTLMQEGVTLHNGQEIELFDLERAKKLVADGYLEYVGQTPQK